MSESQTGAGNLKTLKNLKPRNVLSNRATNYRIPKGPPPSAIARRGPRADPRERRVVLKSDMGSLPRHAEWSSI